MEKADKIGLILAYVGVIIITLIGVASAETIYAGECASIEFPNMDDVNWSVEGNSSDMNGFSYEKNGTNITYCFHLMYKPDNFTITFYNYQSITTKDNGGSSRGTSCIYDKNFDWECSEWGGCDGTQTRICKEYNNCHNTYGKPNETQTCLVAGGGGPGPPITKEDCIEGYVWNETKQECMEEPSKIPLWGRILQGGIILIVLIIFIIIAVKEYKSRKKSKKKKPKKK